jgi:hypothetical protein
MLPLDRICEVTGARAARPGQRIQSLWSGYGEVVRVHLDGAAMDTVVVKHVRPPRVAHPRKLRSYVVERAWYRDWSGRCPAGSRVAHCYGAWAAGSESVFVLEDMDASGFAVRRRFLSDANIAGCLSWLAHFHATFLGMPPTGLWEVGTYWHLATRPDELAAMRDRALRLRAPELDARLSGARFLSVVHGDAKPANFCFASDDSAVAAVDFQYVGGGCGMKDVAYLLGACLGSRERDRETARWLDVYFGLLCPLVPAAVASDLEAEWRGLYDIATLDFDRFLDGWR